MLDSGQVNVSDGKFEFRGSSSIASHPSAESGKVWLHHIQFEHRLHLPYLSTLETVTGKPILRAEEILWNCCVSAL